MKTPSKIISSIILIVSVLSIVSCNKDNIEDLEKRIAELEALTSKEDSVIFNDLVISSQESMDVMNGRGITNILGTLIISNCTDLRPLTGLKSVEGLIIEIPAGLNSLEGLEGLRDLDLLMLDFQVNSVNLSALDGLENISSLNLRGKVPASLSFPNISSLESFFLDANTSSIVLSGFDEISSIDYLYLSNYSGNLEIKGFAKLTSVMDLNLNANSLIISGFNALTSLTGLNISSENLNCSGFNGMKSIEYLTFNGYHLDISGFNSLTSLGWLGFSGSTLDVTGFTNLKNLNSLDASIEHGVNGLNNIKTIQTLRLDIGNSDNFLLGLSSVGTLHLYSYSYNRTNPIVSLADLGLKSLNSIGGLYIDLMDLESLSGFDFSNSNLEYFNIYNSPKLVNIAEFSTYTGPLQSLSFYGTGLISLEGLENVTSISFLDINSNLQLGNWCAIKDIFNSISVNQRYIFNNLLNPLSSDDITGCN